MALRTQQWPLYWSSGSVKQMQRGAWVINCEMVYQVEVNPIMRLKSVIHLRSTFLLVSPLVWFFLSMSYRSRWAYDSNACITSAARRQKRGGKYEETYYEDPDEDEVIVSRNGADTVERPKRRIRKY